MSFGKFMVIPVFIAIQAFVLMLITPYAKTLGEGADSLATWITFQAWAMYFLAGCSIKMALKVLAGYAGGIVASIAVFELGDALAGNAGLGGYWGYALAVLIVVTPVIAMERVPGLNFIPSWFIGAGVFFAFMGTKGLAEHNATVYTNIAVPEIAACVVGLVFGWVSVTFRVWYEKKVAAAA
ncbi:MAG: DUF1097 domain-containing protein [Planctomycetota bacterium]|jgi:hypothetical protein|nr:DUF1097 domain-containing protein [Planctomycetota bacterium]